MSIAYWRPSYKCLYVISNISGNISNLEIISRRIFPPRIFKNQEDEYIFLGDYICYNNYSYEVLDKLIQLKELYPDRIFFLKGKSEDLLLKCLDGKNLFDHFKENGGLAFIKSYIDKNKYNININEININILKSLIPTKHIEFLNSLLDYKQIDSTIFSNGLPNVSKLIKDNTSYDFIYGDKNYEDINNLFYVTNINKINTHIKDNVLYLSEGIKNTVLIDYNSMKCMMVKNIKTKMYTHELICL